MTRPGSDVGISTSGGTARPPRVLPADASGHAVAIGTLARGGIVGIPTDTVYGICCVLDAPGGVERLFAAKSRPPDQAIMVLADGLDQLASTVMVTAAAHALERFWPGGLTLV